MLQICTKISLKMEIFCIVQGGKSEKKSEMIKGKDWAKERIILNSKKWKANGRKMFIGQIWPSQIEFRSNWIYLRHFYFCSMPFNVNRKEKRFFLSFFFLHSSICHCGSLYSRFDHSYLTVTRNYRWWYQPGLYGGGVLVVVGKE